MVHTFFTYLDCTAVGLGLGLNLTFSWEIPELFVASGSVQIFIMPDHKQNNAILHNIP